MSIEKLRNKAKKALLDGKYPKALECFEELHKAEPKDLRTYVKLAELREKTGDSVAAVQDYIKIAKAYAEQGFVVQAIAINKIILRINPEKTEVQERLQELSSERGDTWAVSTIKPQDGLRADDINLDKQAKLNVERTPLLADLSGDELDSFINSLTLKNFSAGEYIYEYGVESDCLYLIGMGAVRLKIQLATGGKRVFSRLSDGDFFGEHAFMSRSTHTDVAVAETDVSLLVIDRETFDVWVKKHAKIQDTVESFYRQRVLDRILAMTPVFEAVPADARMALARKFNMRSFVAGDVVVEEGKPGDSFFLIRSGHVEVSTSDIKHAEQKIALSVMGEGAFFGEVALLTDKPRTATVVAKDDLELMELTRQDFNAIALEYPSVISVVESYQKKRVQDTIKTLMQRGS